MDMTKALVVCFCYSTWVFCFSSGGLGMVYNKQAYDLLPPLLKELSERPSWKEGTPGPHSVAIKYMKRLYKMSATKEGVPKTHKSLEYNTVRLFTPRTECKPGSKRERAGDMQSLDLSFNVDRVAVLEQLLQSVLLYSVSRQFASSNITCTCILQSLDQKLTNPVCPRAPHTFEFQLRNKQRWIEVDVTSLLKPFLLNNRRKIHLAFNFTCLKNNQHYNLAFESQNRITRSPPSLLLYLNDTSPKAYQRKGLFDNIEASAWPQRKPLPNIPAHFRDNIQMRRSSRMKRGEDFEGIGENSLPAVPQSYNFSELIKQFVNHQNECELHSFRLRFSQLDWDKWILAPHRYNPDYCKGECPRLVGHKYGSPVHTMVQNIIYEKLDSSIPRPSCVPSEYRPMSVLTIEPDNSIAYKEYQDMIATKCTCR